MNEVEVLKTQYWSKSEAFLLPLTGLPSSQRYKVESFLFWEDYSIENYQLIVKYIYGHKYKEFVKHCKDSIFPILDKKGYLTESFDYEGETVFILDISEWALDIQMFLAGRYSKFSKEAKGIIDKYHSFYKGGIMKSDIKISIALAPYEEYPLLGNRTAIEYVAEHYGIDIGSLKKLSELGSIYDTEAETLIMDEKLALVTA